MEKRLEQIPSPPKLKEELEAQGGRGTGDSTVGAGGPQLMLQQGARGRKRPEYRKTEVLRTRVARSDREKRQPP